MNLNQLAADVFIKNEIKKSRKRAHSSGSIKSIVSKVPYMDVDKVVEESKEHDQKSQTTYTKSTKSID